MTGRAVAPVVVAVDDTATSDDAVEWAAAEAAARRCPLRLVHRPRPLPPGDPHGIALPVPAVPDEGGEAVLLDALDRARRVAPDVPMAALPLGGPLAPALVAETGRAGLLVLGGRRRSWLRRLLTGSVSMRVAAGSACPVVVVRPRAGADDGPPAPPRVVVGVDGGAAAPAVGFAFRAARQRRVPLVALHAWTPDLPADLDGAPASRTAGEAIARRVLDRAVDPWRREFPDVPVRCELVPGRPGDALVAGSRGAALLVVGSRGSVLGALVGPVGRLALHGAGVPLAVVGRGGATAGAPGRDDDLRGRRPDRHDGNGAAGS